MNVPFRRTRTWIGRVAVALVALAAFPAVARAEARRPDRIELGRMVPRVSHLRPTAIELTMHWDDLQPGIDDLPLPCPSLELRGPIKLVMPECGPDGLDLRIRAKDFELSVGADMGDGKYPIACRSDCMSSACYFWLRTSYDLTPRLTVFVESFQGASAIVGSTLPPPSFAWDGFQVQPGLRVRFSDTWTFEGGPVIYTMSATNKPGGLGCRLGFAWEF